jgi:hypothetical protein
MGREIKNKVQETEISQIYPHIPIINFNSVEKSQALFFLFSEGQLNYPPKIIRTV